MIQEPVKVKELNPFTRAESFQEVVSGYTQEEAIKEANRCLQCKNPACISGCPVGIDIKTFIKHIQQADFERAFFVIKERNDFPSICGRVCPAEYQCRKACVLTKKGQKFASQEAINIHFLERFAGDYGIKHNLKPSREKEEKIESCKVAVVGSGPAGLSVAGALASKGVKISLFESLHKLGGVLQYGIPPFRLPRGILQEEVDYLQKTGVKFFPNVIVGKTKSLTDLFEEGFKAIFLGLGAGVPSFLGIKGENSANVYSANEFLTRVNLMSAFKFPEFHTPVNIGKHVVVIGGGNTAIDAARVALRLQNMSRIKPDTRVFYRRTDTEMPARRLEIEHARQEGVKFRFLVQPVEFESNRQGQVKKISCLDCELAEPDESGRRRPVPVEGSKFSEDCDLAVIAIGLKSNRILIDQTQELETDRYGHLKVNPLTLETSVKGVFAGGDIVGGEGTVIEAMGHAKKASLSIIEYLKQ